MFIGMLSLSVEELGELGEMRELGELGEMRELGEPNRCRFFILGWRQDKDDKEGKKTRGENRTEFGSVKLTSKSRNALFFVLTLPCLLVYLSSLSYLNRNLKKPTLVRLGEMRELGELGELGKRITNEP